MKEVALTEAALTLADLIREAAQGEEVAIADPDGISVLLVPLIPRNAPPKFGSAQGQIQMADDFDAPLEDFSPYMP